jgi:magnesium transporter
MINTLYLPELREYLAESNTAELREFCTALHPARTAEFMEGLTAEESWRVLREAEIHMRAEIFHYLERSKQIEIIEKQDRDEIAALVAALAPDDRVDVLGGVPNEVVDDLLTRVPPDERRDILRLSAYPEGTAGAIMTTEVAGLAESLTVTQALDELRRQAEHLETIYYIYVVDDAGHLRGLVSARQLISAMRRPDTRLSDLMEEELVSAHAAEDQEEVARKVARYDLLAIPVVDDERRLLGIVTHDDVIDVLRAEATEDAQRIAGVAPLEKGYLKTGLFTLSWKRGMWLTILFFTALFTASALRLYEGRLEQWPWLIIFIPLIMSCGGNSGNQSATLIITSLAVGEVRLRDWLLVVWREVRVGLMLGGLLAVLGLAVTWVLASEVRMSPFTALVVPLTLILVVTFGAVVGSLLPLLFKRLGLDPALMSNPFVAGISDILAIVVYMNVAMALLSWTSAG